MSVAAACVRQLETSRHTAVQDAAHAIISATRWQ